MAWPAYIGLSVPLTFDLLTELDPQSFSVRGTELLTRYFPIGQTGPITVLARRDAPLFGTAEGKSQLSRLTTELYRFRYRDSDGQRSPPHHQRAQPDQSAGRKAGRHESVLVLGRRNLEARDNPRIVGTFLSKAAGYQGKVTRLDLVAQYDPFSMESARLLDHLQDRLLSIAADPSSPWHGTEFAFAGTTAIIRDLAEVNQRAFRIAVLTCLVVLAVLVVLLRRLWVSLF